MIKVLDDFIPRYHQECILSHAERVNWKHSNNVSGINWDVDLGGPVLSTDQNGYYYNIFSTDSSDNDEIFLGLCLPMIALAKTFIGESIMLERVRAGKFVKSDQNGIHRPHTDYFTKHYTLLYYVNDSDGDTFLFNEVAESHNPVYPSKMTLKQKISPKMGRAVLFDGLIYHASSAPMHHDSRMAININLFSTG